MQDKSVAKHRTGIIKSCIATQLKAYFSAKSLCYGGMTHLAWDPAVTYEESVALGGWATPSNSDFYVWVYLVSIIPSILSLAGYPDPIVLPHLPQIHLVHGSGLASNWLPADKLRAFVDELFLINIPQFQAPSGKLRPLLMTVLAVMLMHFQYVFQTYS
jgi:hypothetical protein